MTTRIFQTSTLIRITCFFLLKASVFGLLPISTLDLYVETGHSSPPGLVTFSADGKLLASGGGSDHSIKLWDVSTGMELYTFHNEADVVTAIFAPDGKTLISASVDDTIRFWSVESGKEVRRINRGVGFETRFSFDGRYVATRGAGMVLYLCDLSKDGKCSALAETNNVDTCAFSPKGDYVAIASFDGALDLYEIVTGRCNHLLPSDKAVGKRVALAFSTDGRYLASGDTTVRIWNVKTGKEMETLDRTPNLVRTLAFCPKANLLAGTGDGSSATFWIWKFDGAREPNEIKAESTLTGKVSFEENSLAFSPDGKLVASTGTDRLIRLWDVSTRHIVRTLGMSCGAVNSVASSPSGNLLLSSGDDAVLRVWNLGAAADVRNIKGHTKPVVSSVFSPDGRLLASASADESLRLWDLRDGLKERRLLENVGVGSIAFSPDSHYIASAAADNSVRIVNVDSGTERVRIEGQEEDLITSVIFSPDGRRLATGGWDKTARVWDIESAQEIQRFDASPSQISSLAFTPDGRYLVAGALGPWADQNRVIVWDLSNGSEVRTLKNIPLVHSVAVSADGQWIGVGCASPNGWLWSTLDPDKLIEISGHSNDIMSVGFSPDSKLFITGSADGTVGLTQVSTGLRFASLVSLTGDNWVVVTPNGLFDTSKSLDRINGMHWIGYSAITKPIPIEAFMRQYYQPGLLMRTIECVSNGVCSELLKPLPSIADLNRVQTNVRTPKILANGDGTVDVVVEVTSKAEDVTTSAEAGGKKRRMVSGVYDLRLFRDGQLVGTTASSERLQEYIDKAPGEVAKDQEAYKKDPRNASLLLNTNEDKLWRDANVIIPNVAGEKGYSGSTCVVDPKTPTKAVCTFRNVKLPRDGRKEVEFTAYAFNADRVKSDTATFKYTLPAAMASAPARKGRAFVISIGVNASENPQYDLQYAANDARKMQEIVGAKLSAEKDKYFEVVQVPLISDFARDQKDSDVPAENGAQKAIIKGVFSLLAGNEREVPAEVLKQIPNREKIKAVEPEDTLIITYSGHGYADQAGIFYLLPYDIGKDTSKLTPDVLKRMISSDELSLWMRDITATEMVMVIDACHSAAAVQGDGFKPGPMGSRGLGQLSYDKGMKILSATQADNVALELNTLQQGLLSYALLQDGINSKLANTNNDKELTTTEWLTYAVGRVPELYQEVKEGKRDILLNGKEVKDVRARAEIAGSDAKQKTSLDLQRPSLFDFKKRNKDRPLFTLN